MKKIYMTGLVFLVTVFMGMTFAKSSSRSSKSSSSKSTKSTSTASKPKPDATDKQGADKMDNKTNRHTNKKIHRCRLPDGKIDNSKSQQECLMANGKWVKY